MFLGVPFNIASYALLTLILAQITGNKPGEFIHTFGDLHYYENHVDAIKEQLQRKPLPFPTIKISPSIKEIDDFKPELVELVGYEAHPPIKASLTPVGGLVTKAWKDFVQKNKNIRHTNIIILNISAGLAQIFIKLCLLEQNNYYNW